MQPTRLIVTVFALFILTACQPAEHQPVFTPSADSTATPLPLAAVHPQMSIQLPGRIQSFDISPDQSTIALGTTNGVVLYDFKTFKLIRSLTQTHSYVTSLAWSPDGKKLAAGDTAILSSDLGEAHLLVWDTSTWKILFDPDLGENMANDTIPALAWSADNRSLAWSGPLNNVTVLDTQTGKRLSYQQEFSTAARDLSWSPDGTRLVAAGDLAYSVRRWKVDTDEAVRLFDPRASASMQVAWSPDGKRIASGHAGGAVCLWTVATNHCDGLIQAHREAVYSLAWSPDGAKLATGGGVIRIWDTQTGKLLTALGEDEKVVYSHIAWPALGFPLVTLQTESNMRDGTVLRFWDIPTGTVLAEFVGMGGGE